MESRLYTLNLVLWVQACMCRHTQIVEIVKLKPLAVNFSGMEEWLIRLSVFPITWEQLCSAIFLMVVVHLSSLVAKKAVNNKFMHFTRRIRLSGTATGFLQVNLCSLSAVHECVPQSCTGSIQELMQNCIANFSSFRSDSGV